MSPVEGVALVAALIFGAIVAGGWLVMLAVLVRDRIRWFGVGRRP